MSRVYCPAPREKPRFVCPPLGELARLPLILAALLALAFTVGALTGAV